MVHLPNHQVAHVSLHYYCTKVQDGFFEAGYLVIYHLDLV